MWGEVKLSPGPTWAPAPATLQPRAWTWALLSQAYTWAVILAWSWHIPISREVADAQCWGCPGASDFPAPGCVGTSTALLLGIPDNPCTPAPGRCWPSQHTYSKTEIAQACFHCHISPCAIVWHPEQLCKGSAMCFREPHSRSPHTPLSFTSCAG